jgi:hypothetical protein
MEVIMSNVEALISAPEANSERYKRPKPSAASGLLVPEDAANFLGFKASTLANDRCTRKIGIPFLKFGRTVRYRLSDLEKFVASRGMTEGAV